MTMTFEVFVLHGKRCTPRILPSDNHRQTTKLFYNTDGTYTLAQPYDQPNEDDAYGGPAVSLLLPHFQDILDNWPSAQGGADPFWHGDVPPSGMNLIKTRLVAYQGRNFNWSPGSDEVFLVVEERVLTYEGPSCSWCNQVLLDFVDFRTLAQVANDHVKR